MQDIEEVPVEVEPLSNPRAVAPWVERADSQVLVERRG